MNDWIRQLFENKDLLRMGHCQREEDLNLGMGWIYYGLTRLIRPRRVVVIGSYRGFSPLIFGKALHDNEEDGRLTFIDPSLVDDFWKDPEAVEAHFKHYGVTNIEHHLMTTQEFAGSEADAAITEVGLLMVDGYHTAEQARFDYETFKNRLASGGMVLFHDSVVKDTAKLYGMNRTYERNVRDYIEELRNDPGLDVFDIPMANGLTLLRHR